MYGAILGDILGSPYEWRNHKSKKFPLFGMDSKYTDDSVLTLAVCRAILDSKPDYSDLSKQTIRAMHELGNRYAIGEYGGGFNRWLASENPKPYNSLGNGSAMRVSGCGWAGDTLEDALKLSDATTCVTHNHPEGMKGARATTAAIWMARHGSNMDDIRDYIEENFYEIDFILDGIRDTYEFDETCQETVPQALEAFFESVSFEDAIRNAISIGGDSDTVACITGSVAEAYYGIPDELRYRAEVYLDDELLDILNAFEKRWPPKIL